MGDLNEVQYKFEKNLLSIYRVFWLNLLADIVRIKSITSNKKISLIEKLNIVNTSRWSKEEIQLQVKEIVSKAMCIGGLIIAQCYKCMSLKLSYDALVNTYRNYFEALKISFGLGGVI